MCALGIWGMALKWLESFLVKRIHNFCLPEFLVPQGSHCGPVIFNLFSNDVGILWKVFTFCRWSETRHRRFIQHYNKTIKQAFKQLEYVLRHGNEYSLRKLKIIYCSYVLSCLEYASMVCSRHYCTMIRLKIYKKILENICSQSWYGCLKS